MGAVDAGSTVELVLLEAAYNDDLKCESKHIARGNETCSVEVTHTMLTKCKGSFLVCANHAASILTRDRQSGVCSKCKRPIPDCVTLRLI